MPPQKKQHPLTNMHERQSKTQLLAETKSTPAALKKNAGSLVHTNSMQEQHSESSPIPPPPSLGIFSPTSESKVLNSHYSVTPVVHNDSLLKHPWEEVLAPREPPKHAKVQNNLREIFRLPWGSSVWKRRPTARP